MRYGRFDVRCFRHFRTHKYLISLGLFADEYGMLIQANVSRL